MSPAPLFDDRERDDPDYKRGNESTYELLDRVSRPGLAAPRPVLNEWFANWPFDDREELRARLTSKDDSNFDGAFWELYLHETYRRLGFEIERDPNVPEKETHPDFLMSKDGGEFYMEATIVGPPQAQVTRQRREHKFTEAINDAYHPDFLIRLRRVAVGEQDPPRQAVAAAVQKWMDGLDLEEEKGQTGYGERDPDVIEVAGTHIIVLPWPRSEEMRGKPDFPTVATYPPDGGILSEGPPILDDLRAKASKFGKLDKPYVIALLLRRGFATERDVEEALFGPEVVTFAVGPEGPVTEPRLARDPKGLWQRGQERRATRVSAVLSVVHTHPWSIGRAEPKLWHHPWAAIPLTADMPWASVIGA